MLVNTIVTKCRCFNASMVFQLLTCLKEYNCLFVFYFCVIATKKCKLYIFCSLQLLPECKYKKTTVDFVIGDETFKWSGSTLVSAGYTSVYTWHALEEEESAGSVQFEKGQAWEVEQVRRGKGIIIGGEGAEFCN